MSTCRSCAAPLTHTFVDLGVSPLANSYLKPGQLAKMEPFYPLHALICDQCLLVQLDEFESPEHIFSDYAYFSSYSQSWLQHSAKYVDGIVARLDLKRSHFVVEIASNDGYLLKNFLRYQIPSLGIEPAQNVAEVANKAGIKTRNDFFGSRVAGEIRAESGCADLMIANNVLAHVPDLRDFISGFKTLLGPDGVVTFEFPHLLQLIENGQFDTVYHEHFSYFSLLSVQYALANHNLRVFDVEILPTHGGSLRLFVCHESSQRHTLTTRVAELRKTEERSNLHHLQGYSHFAERTHKIKRDLLRFLIEARETGKRVAAYGAPAKGNTLLNFCGIGRDLIEFTVDMSPHKQNTFLPGTRIPVLEPRILLERKPDYILILPWNLEAEIIEQWKAVRAWGAQFVVSHPELKVLA